MSISLVLYASAVLLAPSVQEQEFLVRARMSLEDARAVEARVAVPLESAISAMPEVVRIESLSTRDGCLLAVRLRVGLDADKARRELAKRLRAHDCELLPTYAEARTIQLAVTSRERTFLELGELAYDARAAISTLPGVESVAAIGARPLRIVLAIDAERLLSRGVSHLDIADAVSRCESGDLASLEQLRLREAIALRDVASVSVELAPSEQLVRIDGAPGVLLLVQAQSSADLAALERALSARLPDGVRRLPSVPARLAIELDAGGSLEATATALAGVEPLFAEHTPLWSIARAGLPVWTWSDLGIAAHRGRFEIGLSALPAERELDALRSELRRRHPALDLALRCTPRSNSLAEITLQGGEAEGLAPTARKLRARLAGHASVASTSLFGADDELAWKAQPDRDAMQRLGIADSELERTLLLAQQTSPIARMRNDRELAVHILPPPADALQHWIVRSTRGELVALGTFCAFSQVERPSSILRHDRQRAVRLDVELHRDANVVEGLRDLERILSEIGLPEGVRTQIRYGSAGEPR